MTENSRLFFSALLFDGHGGARTLSDDEVSDWSAADGILWLDCDQSNKNARKWLIENGQIGDNARAVLLAEETRPRSSAEGGGLVLVMRGINMNPGAVPDDMVAIRIWIEENRVISVHRRQIMSLEDVRQSLAGGVGPRTSGEYLVMLTGFLSERIEAAVENIEQMLDQLESDVAVGNIAELRATLSAVRRRAAAIRRHLAPQRVALDRLIQFPGSVLSDSETLKLREEGEHLTRYIEDLDLARENALVTQEEMLNRVAQEQNARMYVLSIVAAIFLPLSFVTGLLGMNVAGLPGTDDPNGFRISAAVMISLGVALIGYFKWRRWL